MDNNLRNTLLLDLYGKLLTEKQYDVLDLYYNNDYSLSEIGELLKISRQGVRDNIKRGEESLFKYESALLLLEKHMDKLEKIKKINDLVDDIDKICKDFEKTKLLKALVKQLFDN